MSDSSSLDQYKRPAENLVDPKSWELAEHFLFGEPHQQGDTQSLAADIQQAVEDWFSHRESLEEAARRFQDCRALLCQAADETDFMIMRWAQRNPRVCCSNYATGEPISFGGRKQA